jgi:hypothetical protein
VLADLPPARRVAPRPRQQGCGPRRRTRRVSVRSSRAGPDDPGEPEPPREALARRRPHRRPR